MAVLFLDVLCSRGLRLFGFSPTTYCLFHAKIRLRILVLHVCKNGPLP